MFKFTTLAAFMATSVLANEKCLLPVDVMILQDTTGSFHDDLPNVRRILPDLVKKILVQNPGSYFGAADFKDKPYRDLGEPAGADPVKEPADYCFKLASPLTDDTDAFCKAYEKLFATAGGDTPEATYQALANLATESSVQWRKLSNEFHKNVRGMDLAHETGARLIILSTDANPHNPGDYNLYNGSDPSFEPVADHPPPMHMTEYPNNPTGINPDEQCKVYDYPSQEQVIKLLKDAKINVVFLIPHPDQSTMASYDYVAAVEGEKVWKEFNSKLGQRESFVQYIKADSSDLEQVVLKAMAEVSDYVCNETTTTPEPTTAAPTTTTTAAPTTTTAAPTTTTAAPTTTTTAAPTTTTAAPTTTTTAAPATTTTAAPTTSEPATTTSASADTSSSTSAGPSTSTSAPTSPATSQSTSEEYSTSSSHNCPCPKPCPTPGPCDCPCPEVVIKLRHRPQKMHFDISNEKSE